MSMLSELGRTLRMSALDDAVPLSAFEVEGPETDAARQAACDVAYEQGRAQELARLSAGLCHPAVFRNAARMQHVLDLGLASQGHQLSGEELAASAIEHVPDTVGVNMEAFDRMRAAEAGMPIAADLGNQRTVSWQEQVSEGWKAAADRANARNNVIQFPGGK